MTAFPTRPTFCVLPICTGVACGVTPDILIPIAAAVVVAALAPRIVDDCADEDDPNALDRSIGRGRAVNAAAALSMTALQALHGTPAASACPNFLVDAYLQAYLQVCHGQDQDMRQAAGFWPIIAP